MSIIQKLCLDTVQENRFAPLVAKQYDVEMRNYVATIVEDGKVIPLGDYDTATFNIRRYDETQDTFGATIVENTVSIVVPAWGLAVPGMAKCSVSLFRNGMKVLTTTSFGLYVQPAERTGEIVVYTAPSALAAGTYYITIDGNAYHFTTTRPVPAGGNIALKSDMTEAYTYDEDGDQIETSAVVPGTSGTQLPYAPYVDLINRIILTGADVKSDADRAEASADAAAQSANAAAEAAVSAAMSEDNAQEHAENAEASAQTAAANANSTLGYKNAAIAAKNGAIAAQTAAEAAQTAAEAARNAANVAATNAASSEASASASAEEAAGYAEQMGELFDRVDVVEAENAEQDFRIKSNKNALYGTVIEDKPYTFADLSTAAIPTEIGGNAAIDGGEVKLTEIGGKSIVEGGEIVDAVVSGVKINGYNLWNEEWENGAYSLTTGAKSDSQSSLLCIRCKDFIKVAPNTEYYFEFGDYTSWGYVMFYNESKQLISYVNPYGKAAANPNLRNPVTTPSDCAYMTFFMHSNYGLVYNGDICVSFSSSLNETYRPYIAPQTIELPAEQTLRSARDAADKIRFVKQSNGTWNIEKVQTIGVVDLGTRTWTYNADRKFFYSSGFNSKPLASTSVVANALSATYATVASTYVYNNAPSYDMSFGVSNTGSQIYLSNQAYTDATALRAALNGVMLNYELAEPVVTTIAEGLTEDQIAALAQLGGSIEIVGNTTNAHPTLAVDIQTAIPGGSSDIPDIAEIRRGAALGATAVQPEAGKGLFSGRYADLTGKPTIPAPTAYITHADEAAVNITLADNTEYTITNCASITLAYPAGRYEAFISVTFGADVSLTFPTGTKYIGDVPTFAAGETWEISVKNGVVIAGKVE